MKNIRLYAASGVFLLLTAIKLISPGTVSALKEKLQPALGADFDYVSAVTALGESISQADGDIVQALSLLYAGQREAPEARAVFDVGYTPDAIGELMADRSYLLSDFALPVKETAVTEAQETEAEPAGEAEDAPAAAPSEPDAAPETTPEAVAVFLASQSEYSELAVPANVSYDMPALALAYTRPASGTASGFGYRLHPIAGEVKFHYGTDIAADSGDDILAFADGVVSAAGDSDSYGLYLMITHAGGYTTLYAHCSQLIAHEGDAVSMGQLIALVGQTGRATGPHLHFELMQNGVYLNPEYYLSVI